MMARRDFGLGIVGTAAAALGLARGGDADARDAKTYPVAYSDADWKQRLRPEPDRVLRGKGTFVCAACDQPVFTGERKFESGTGWPSFYAPIEGGIGTSSDNALFMTRTEVHCARCGGHLGHVFEDGPKPTGLRYCMNGVAMKFR